MAKELITEKDAEKITTHSGYSLILRYLTFKGVEPILGDEEALASFLETQNLGIGAKDFACYYAGLKQEIDKLRGDEVIGNYLRRFEDFHSIVPRGKSLINLEGKIDSVINEFKPFFNETMGLVFNAVTKYGWNINIAKTKGHDDFQIKHEGIHAQISSSELEIGLYAKVVVEEKVTKGKLFWRKNYSIRKEKFPGGTETCFVSGEHIYGSARLYEKCFEPTRFIDEIKDHLLQTKNLKRFVMIVTDISKEVNQYLTRYTESLEEGLRK